MGFSARKDVLKALDVHLAACSPAWSCFGSSGLFDGESLAWPHACTPGVSDRAQTLQSALGLQQSFRVGHVEVETSVSGTGATGLAH